MPVNYIPLNVGIDFGSDYLTNEVAYFLGGILAADESAIKMASSIGLLHFAIIQHI